MGNFRHQSIRTTERGAEKEVDKERERDLRDREGQERLRSVSYTDLCVCIVTLNAVFAAFRQIRPRPARIVICIDPP